MIHLFKYILSGLLIVTIHSLTAQTWPKTYGEPNRKDISYDIEEAYDGSYYILGHYLDQYNAPEATWLIKTGVNGDVLWEKVVNNTGYNKPTSITQTSDGGILLCGLIRYEGDESSDPFVTKLDACGEKLWCRVFSENLGGSTPSKWASDVKETPSGDIIVLVNQYGNHPIHTMHLFKLNAGGEVLWRNSYAHAYNHPGSVNPYGNKLLITSTGDYLIVGDIYWEDPWNPGGTVFALRPMITKVDSLGTEKWVMPIGLNDTLSGGGLGVAEITPTNVIAVGYSWSGGTFDEGLVVSLTIDGLENSHRKINAKAIDSSMNRVLFYDIYNVDSAFVFGGVMGIEPVGNPPMETISDTNVFNHSPNFYQVIRHENLSTPYSLSIANFKKVLSSSPNNNWDISLNKLNLNLEYDTLDPGTYTYDSLCTLPGLPQSGFISLDDCDLFVDIDEIPTARQYQESIRWIPIKAYPNPVTEGILTLEFENTKHHQNMQLRFYDDFGRQIHSQKIYKGQQDTDVDVSGWPPGIYIAVVYSDGSARGKAKFVVR